MTIHKTTSSMVRCLGLTTEESPKLFFSVTDFRRANVQEPATAIKLDNKQSHNRLLELSRPNHRLNRSCQKPHAAVQQAKKKYTSMVEDPASHTAFKELQAKPARDDSECKSLGRWQKQSNNYRQDYFRKTLRFGRNLQG